jgi:hypothetical protein
VVLISVVFKTAFQSIKKNQPFEKIHKIRSGLLLLVSCCAAAAAAAAASTSSSSSDSAASAASPSSNPPPLRASSTPKPCCLHSRRQMQFQSPVALRLLPTLPAPQQLKGPLPTGSQTDRAGGKDGAAKSNAAAGSKTHRVMVSTNATSLAAVKQASERNRTLFDKISASVCNISAALRADSVRGADAAEAANAAQDLHDVVKGIIHTPATRQIQTTSRTTGSTASGKAPLHSSAHAPARGGRGAAAKLPSSQKTSTAALEPETSSANPLIEQIERLMLACSVNSNEQQQPRRGQHKGKSVSKGTKAGADYSRAAAADALERGVLRVKHVPLGWVGATMHPPVDAFFVVKKTVLCPLSVALDVCNVSDIAQVYRQEASCTVCQIRGYSEHKARV